MGEPVSAHPYMVAGADDARRLTVTQNIVLQRDFAWRAQPDLREVPTNCLVDEADAGHFPEVLTAIIVKVSL